MPFISEITREHTSDKYLVPKGASNALWIVQDSLADLPGLGFCNLEAAKEWARDNSIGAVERYDVMDNRAPGKDTLHMYRKGEEVFLA